MGILGAVTGLQLGALWLQQKYMKLDPDGRCIKEMKAIGEEVKALKQSES